MRHLKTKLSFGAEATGVSLTNIIIIPRGLVLPCESIFFNKKLTLFKQKAMLISIASMCVITYCKKIMGKLKVEMSHQELSLTLTVCNTSATVREDEVWMVESKKWQISKLNITWEDQKQLTNQMQVLTFWPSICPLRCEYILATTNQCTNRTTKDRLPALLHMLFYTLSKTTSWDFCKKLWQLTQH